MTEIGVARGEGGKDRGGGVTGIRVARGEGGTDWERGERQGYG